MTAIVHLRAWIVADGVTVPAIAVGNNVHISNDKIRLTFIDGGAEIYAIACGKRYRVEENQEIYVTAEVTFRSQTANLKNNNRYYEFVPQGKSSEAIAFYRDSKNHPVSVKIVDEITGNDRVTILAGGKVLASTNLIGKTVKFLRLPAVYQEAVVISSEDVEGYRIFSLYLKDEEVYLSEYADCQIIKNLERADAKRRTLEFLYNPENISDRRI